jgi:hypothetical protein
MYLIDSKNKIVYLRLVGTFTKDLLVQAFKDLVSAPEWKKDFNILQDITQENKAVFKVPCVYISSATQAHLRYGQRPCQLYIYPS